MQFAGTVTILEHNFGYQEGNLLISLFGSNESRENILEAREKGRRK